MLKLQLKCYFTQICSVLKYCLLNYFFQAVLASLVSTYGWQHAYFSLEHQYNTIPLSVVCIFDICNKPRQLSQYHYSLGIFGSSLVLSLSCLHLSFPAIFLPLLMNHFAAVLEKISSIMRSCFSEWGRETKRTLFLW